MTATNHALTGTLIGLIIGQPLIAVPAALASHFICDALPHFGTGQPPEVVLKANWYRSYLVSEAAICLGIVILLALCHPQHWVLAAVCAFAAASPDLLSFNRYLKTSRGLAWHGNWYTKFAKNIQWFERPVGAVVEVAWFIACIVLLTPFFR